MRRASFRIAPREEWKRECREMLFAEIRKDPLWQDAPLSVREPASLARLFNLLLARAVLKPVLAGVLIFAVVSYSSVSTVQAAKASLPGEPLYSVKLGIEAAQVGVAFSESKKAELEISFATTRLFEVSKILAQDSTAESGQHIEQAIKRFSNDLGSVQKRLEKLGNEEKSEEKVLKISKLVNDKTTELEKNLLVIKEKLAEQKPPDALGSPVAVAPEGMPSAEELPAGTSETGAAPTITEQSTALGLSVIPETATSTEAGDQTSTSTTAVADASDNTSASEDLLATLNDALLVVDQTNIKSLEVFVGKAQTSKSEVVQQEAVDKIQKKIETIEKKIDTARASAERLSDANAVAPSASSTQPVLNKDANAASEESIPAPQQVQEVIDEAKKILDSKNISDLGKAVDKVIEAKAIVQDAASVAESNQQNAGTSQKQNQDTKEQIPSTAATSTESSLNQKPNASPSSSSADSNQDAI